MSRVDGALESFKGWGVKEVAMGVLGGVVCAFLASKVVGVVDFCMPNGMPYRNWISIAVSGTTFVTTGALFGARVRAKEIQRKNDRATHGSGLAVWIKGLLGRPSSN